MKYIFYTTISMPCKTNLEKAKTEFSILGEPVEYNKIYNFSGFKIENIFDNKLFLEQYKKNIHFNCNLYVFKCAFIFIRFEFEADEDIPFIKFFEDEKLGEKFRHKERKEFKDLGIKSISEISTQLILKIFYNFDSFSDIVRDMDESDTISTFISLFKAVEKYTCVHPNLASFMVSGSHSHKIFINKKNEGNENIIINNKSSFANKFTVWEDDQHFYFSGDLEQLTIAMIHREMLEEKLENCSYQLRQILNDIATQSSEVSKKIKNKNPIYWEELSITIEVIQLEYIKIQSLITSLLDTFTKSDYLQNRYSEKYYNDFLSKTERMTNLIDSLFREVAIALNSIATPIKAKNDFKLQESTDKVNDRILFLSFIAMTIPLISSLTSGNISSQTKLISSVVILLLPFIYYVSNKYYKKRLVRSNKLIELEEDLKSLRINKEKWEKRIEDIKAYDDDKQKRHSFELQAGETNIQAMNVREKRLKKKIETL